MNRMLYLEALESRVLLSDGAGVEPPEADPPVTVDVTLDPVFDALGFQPEIVQGWGDLVLDADTGTMQPEYGWTYGIFDTGASPITLSYKDQEGENLGGGLTDLAELLYAFRPASDGSSCPRWTSGARCWPRQRP